MTNMNWIPLTQVDQLSGVVASSYENPVMIFKHSTTCPISNTAMNRLERHWNSAEMPIETYYLDLLKYRAVSQQIADYFHVEHQSPQVLIIRNGKPIYTATHFGIDYTDLKKHVVALLPK